MKVRLINAGLFLLRQFSRLPFLVLYLFSDLLYLVFRYVIRYRNKVIDKNLLLAFPDISHQRRVQIKRRYYRHLADVTLETIKIGTISTKELRSRMKFTNVDLLLSPEFANKNIVCIMAHYGNWEWFAILNDLITIQACAIYRPPRSKPMGDYMLRLRTHWGSKQFAMKSSFRDLVALSRTDKWIVGVVADQTPAADKVQYRTKFLNQDTAVHVGAEKIAQKLDTAVVYAWVEKTKRGYYEVTFLPLFISGKDTREHEITDMVTQTIEKQIIHRPELWLWSHNRWKRNTHL